MALNRSSATACLLVLVAGLLALLSPSPSERRERQTTTPKETGPRRPAKASHRIYFRNEAAALEWLREFAKALARGESTEPDPETLVRACAALNADSLEELLKDQSLWAHPPVTTQEAWGRWLRLGPVREALLERFAVVDLPRGLRSFAPETGTLLRAAARRDGAKTLEDWLAFREEWRANPDTAFPDQGVDSLESLALGPDRYRAEIQVVASLMEGWGSSDPEAAWATLNERPTWMTGSTLGGLMAGLRPGSDWKQWSERLEAIDWQKARYGESESSTDPYLVLAGSWIRKDPDLAVDWYRRWQDHSNNTRGAPVAMFPVPGDPGSGGHQMFGGEVFLLSAWIGAEEGEALSWLEKNVTEDHLLGQIIAASTLSEAPKMKVLELIGTPEIRGEAAVKIASDSARPLSGWVGGKKDDRGFVELMNSLYALEDLEDGAREKLAEITVKRLKMD